MMFTLVGADAEDLEARAAAFLSRRGGGGTSDFLKNAPTERLIGTVEQVAEQLATLADAGVHRVMLQHMVHEDLEAVALIGTELIPRVASL
jgi:alkanesulfonate monooxygenase SsuD/methylene tetrahydromethanopterin reductase-like flavin-dependent oxidoreductase (luciferase family)